MNFVCNCTLIHPYLERAAGALLGSRWFLAGGGNNVNGCTDMVSIDLSGLDGGWPPAAPLHWEQVASMPQRCAGINQEAFLRRHCLRFNL